MNSQSKTTWTGRTALITGGASGLGRATVTLMHARGAQIAVLDRDLDEAQRITNDLNAVRPDSALAIEIDVRRSESVADAFSAVDAAGWDVDILVNSAGIREISGALDLSEEEWDRVIGVNLSGSFYCARAAARRMRPRGRGVIINIASVAGLTAIKRRPAYVSSKHGVVGLTKVLAAELGEFGIRVNAIAPGTLRTALTDHYYSDPAFVEGIAEVVPLNADGDATDVAGLAVFLASDEARFISGAVVPVDGAWVAEKAYAPAGSAYDRKAR